MANFLPMQSSPFGEMQLYTPDWSFLTQVMGTKQAEYDRGHKIVKTHFDQLKNSALSNPETEEQREYYFKQLENNLKSIANLDLSKKENINRALEIMKPISEDKAIAYDMAYTAAMNRERAKMQYLKNSTDPEIRKQYNKYSELEMNYADMRMKEAHIDDGSIFDVRPVAHVNFKNFIDDLDKKMKDLGISVKLTEATGDGYMIETKNGPMSIPYFNMWAQMQMGDEYDEIFDVISRVQLETGIRNTMQAERVNRNEAMRIIAEKYSPILVAKETQKELAFNEAYMLESQKLNMFKRELEMQGYPAGQVPESKLNEYQKIVEELEILEKKSMASAQEKRDAQDIDYVISNLSNLFSNDTKDRQVEEWATSTAMVTAEQNIKSDDVWIAKYKESGINRRHAENLKFEKEKHADNLALKERELDIKESKISDDGDEEGSKNWFSRLTRLGSGISSDVLHKVDKLNSSMDEAIAGAHQVAISDPDGVLAMLVEANTNSGETHMDKLAEYRSILDDLYNLSINENMTIDAFKKKYPQYRNVLNEMSYSLGLKEYVEIPTDIRNKAQAEEYLKHVYLGLYEKVNSIIKTNPDNINFNTNLYLPSLELKEFMEKHVASISKYEEMWDQVSNLTTGMVTVDNIKGYTSKGSPILDGSKLEDWQLSQLDNAMSPNIVSGVVETEKYNVKDLNPNVIKLLLTPGNIKSNSIKGTGSFDKRKINKKYETEIYDKYFRNMDGKSLSELFGENLDVYYDASTKEYHFNLRTAKSKDNKEKGTLSFTVDESTISSQDVLRKQFEYLSKKVEIPSIAVEGEWQVLKDNSNAYVKNTEAEKALGIQYVAVSNLDGSITIELKLKDDNSGQWVSQKQTVAEEILNNDANAVNALIGQVKYQYLTERSKNINSKPKGQEVLIPMTR